MSPFEIMKTRLSDTAGVYIPPGTDEAAYLRSLSDEILGSACSPFWVRAMVMPPGLPGVEIGAHVEGWCVARNQGYWLVYDPARDDFHCFWGSNADTLGAHGVYGPPLYCWSA